MATKKIRRRGFSKIGSYKELETSLDLLQYQMDVSRKSNSISNLMSSSPGFGWLDAALTVVAAARRLLKR